MRTAGVMSIHSLFRWERTDNGKDTLSLVHQLSFSLPFWYSFFFGMETCISCVWSGQFFQAGLFVSVASENVHLCMSLVYGVFFFGLWNLNGEESRGEFGGVMWSFVSGPVIPLLLCGNECIYESIL